MDFDDVRSEILEAPEAAPRRRHRGVVVIAAVIAAGALAGGAAAHTAGEGTTTAKPKSSFSRDGHGCKHGDRYKSRPADDIGLRY